MTEDPAPVGAVHRGLHRRFHGVQVLARLFHCEQFQAIPLGQTPDLRGAVHGQEQFPVDLAQFFFKLGKTVRFEVAHAHENAYRKA